MKKRKKLSSKTQLEELKEINEKLEREYKDSERDEEGNLILGESTIELMEEYKDYTKEEILADLFEEVKKLQEEENKMSKEEKVQKQLELHINNIFDDFNALCEFVRLKSIEDMYEYCIDFNKVYGDNLYTLNQFKIKVYKEFRIIPPALEK